MCNIRKLEQDRKTDFHNWDIACHTALDKNKNSKLYQALADAVMRANWEKLKEGSNMCEALKELFADDLRESREQGIIEGRCDITCNSYSCA